MALSLLRNTLAYQLGVRPAVQHRNMSSVFVPDTVAATVKFQGLEQVYQCLGGYQGHLNIPAESPVFTESAKGTSERDAVVFYLLNHAMSCVRKRVHEYEPLGALLPIVEAYHAELAIRSTRMFHYLLLICTRESRHAKLGAELTKLHKDYGSLIQKFHSGLKTESSLGAAKKFLEAPPAVLLGRYTDFLVSCFSKCDFSAGYGGLAWAKIAEVLRDFVHGKLTAEMMLDTAFTLAHNNGPIFNKGMLFEMHNLGRLNMILDVQRSGQIPQLMNTPQGVTGQSPDSLAVALHAACKSLLGSDFEGVVDWYKVEALGSVHKYVKQKKLQDADQVAPTPYTPASVVYAPGTPSEEKIYIFANEYIVKVKR